MKTILLVPMVGIVVLFFMNSFAGRSASFAQSDGKLEEDKIGTAAGTKATTTPDGVLKAAVEGRLTEEWRAKHSKTEPASKLLKRILAERRQKWEEDQLAKFAAADKTPPKGWREKYVEPVAPDTSRLPELPQGWCWLAATAKVSGMKLLTADEDFDFLNPTSVVPTTEYLVP